MTVDQHGGPARDAKAPRARRQQRKPVAVEDLIARANAEVLAESEPDNQELLELMESSLPGFEAALARARQLAGRSTGMAETLDDELALSSSEDAGALSIDEVSAGLAQAIGGAPVQAQPHRAEAQPPVGETQPSGQLARAASATGAPVIVADTVDEDEGDQPFGASATAGTAAIASQLAMTEKESLEQAAIAMEAALDDL
ncbi:MAG: hypothetical protein AAGC55_11100, partial [Myxococcota bacterium]